MPIADIGALHLAHGETLPDVRIAYQTLGVLSANRDNAVLVLHGYTSGPDFVLPTGEAAEGSWAPLVGPGRAIDTEKYFVIAPNMLGSAYGSTGAASIDPRTGAPYGSRFPAISVADIVASQYGLLQRLGVQKLVAVIGVSFGGVLAFQWAISHPGVMGGFVPVLAAPKAPPADAGALRERLAQDPAWCGGDYYGRGDMSGTLTAMRLQTLRNYGVEALLERVSGDQAVRDTILNEAVTGWAKKFDANALFVLMNAMARFDVTAQLDRIRARMLYVLSRTDNIFPASLAATVMPLLKTAGVDATYCEIDSAAGHFASSVDADKWAPTLQSFLTSLKSPQ